jgi:FAD/FMN-containing dehydrogenase
VEQFEEANANGVARAPSLVEAVEGAPAASEEPFEFAEERLESYSGQVVWVRTFRPESHERLRDVLAFARGRGWRVSLRGAGLSFDTQAVGKDLCVVLDRLGGITIDPVAGTATVGPGATWGDILDAALAAGFVPPVMVSSGEITAGGSVSSNALSRFSVTLGREAEHVVQIEIMTPDGATAIARPGEPRFGAAIGGFGYVGAITSITHRLVKLPEAWGQGAVVDTEFETFDGLEDLPDRLIRRVRACEAVDPCACDASRVQAVAATLYLRGRNRGLAFTSKYVAPRPLKPSVIHSPKSLGHRALQLAALFPRLRPLGYFLMFLAMDFKSHYVDELRGYTFFEDGNVWVKRAVRKLGLRVRGRQQSYFLPVPTLDDVGETPLHAFLKEADNRLGVSGLVPALIDVLYLPQDGPGGEAGPWLLSSTRHGAGFKVTFTFQRVSSAPFDREDAFLRSMAGLAAELGGRVHLTKNVVAGPGVVSAMYREDLEEMRAFAAPELMNEFAERIGLADPLGDAE